MSPQYRRKTTEVVAAHQWFQNGDHPDDGNPDTEGEVVRYFWHPGKPGTDLCRKCGAKWNNHGWIEPRKVKGQKYWQEGETVCPGDYIITEAIWTNGNPEYTVISKKLFEGPHGYEEIQTAQQIADAITGNPKVFAESVWESFDQERQDKFVSDSEGAGVLVIPDDLFYRED